MSNREWHDYRLHYSRAFHLSMQKIRKDWKALGVRQARSNAAQQIQPLLPHLPGAGVPGPPPPPPGWAQPVNAAVVNVPALGAGGVGLGGGAQAAAPAPAPLVPAAAPAPAQTQTEEEHDEDDVEVLTDFDPGTFPATDEERQQELSKTIVGNDLGGIWYGGWALGDGTNKVGIWVRGSKDEHVTDRIALKDTYVRAQDWTNIRRWEADRKRGGWRPTEFAIQHRLRRSPDKRHFAGVRKCRVFDK